MKLCTLKKILEAQPDDQIEIFVAAGPVDSVWERVEVKDGVTKRVGLNLCANSRPS